MRTLAIGDIHGCLRAFDALLALVDPQPDDLLVLLGDYVDRGPDSKGVVERVLLLSTRCRLKSLKGNHELMMLAAREDEPHYEGWIKYGGREALRSYGAADDWPTFADHVPAEHWKFLSKCRPHFETASHLFVHANLNPDIPLADQLGYMLYWESLDPSVWRPHESGKTMICGHTPQRSGRPLVLVGAVCIDTWAHGDGWLTCLDIDHETYVQANQRGETRSGSLHLLRQ